MASTFLNCIKRCLLSHHRDNQRLHQEAPERTAPREEELCDPQPGRPSLFQQSGDASAEGSTASNRCETHPFPPGSNKRAKPPETALCFHPAQLE
ncbi:unnamed protein product [Rangifer tarandus platyrhynchus]|uniref:Uncharacterized protein n=2 Tax=Rangifer tarandus platyrhynchus TaxID=3082113 RepID=A0ACB0FN43_RANTA|nr:unnamed protein product [Rangifer tarandus platyrhynchus]CAI9713436.1 unnamed protein product [Rangifer tarandus platyrhynchus]